MEIIQYWSISKSFVIDTIVTPHLLNQTYVSYSPLVNFLYFPV